MPYCTQQACIYTLHVCTVSTYIHSDLKFHIQDWFDFLMQPFYIILISLSHSLSLSLSLSRSVSVSVSLLPSLPIFSLSLSISLPDI